MKLGTRVTILKTGKDVPAVLVDVLHKGEAPNSGQAREYFGFPPTIHGYIGSPYDRYVFKYLGQAGFLIVPDTPEAASLWRRVLPMSSSLTNP